MTDLFLIQKINRIIGLINQNPNIIYAYFQKSNFKEEYGIIFVLNCPIDEELKKIFEQVKEDSLIVLGYQNQKELQTTKTTYYLSERKKLTNHYYNFDWHISINSFIQSHPDVSNQIHQLVNQLIDRSDQNNYYGLGGEMGIYYKHFQSLFKFHKCFTDSSEIYDDYLYNLKESDCIHLVDYKNINLEKFIDSSSSNNILIINISRSGLKELANSINSFSFKQIIYIGCCEETVSRDSSKLTNYFINNIYKLDQFPGTKYFSFVIDFRKTL